MAIYAYNIIHTEYRYIKEEAAAGHFENKRKKKENRNEEQKQNDRVIPRAVLHERNRVIDENATIRGKKPSNEPML